MENANNIPENGNLIEAIECMLFVSVEPVSAAQLAAALEMHEAEVEEAILELMEMRNESGLQVVRVAGGYQLCTKPEYSDVCQKILVPQNQKLTRASLETLAIVAYRQPVTQPELEAIRGVSSSGVMKTLLEKGLVKEVGRKPSAGRPILYGTTPQFLEHMGLEDLSQLPDIDTLAVEKIQELEAAQQNLFKDEEIAAQVVENDVEVTV